MGSVKAFVQVNGLGKPAGVNLAAGCNIATSSNDNILANNGLILLMDLNSFTGCG
jgi:hypothetical protein